MRPLKLTLRGINSYRKEQTIDFETLTSAGLFGIFGPTGSGKSSILDAITLALYARLPRSTKNFININEETAAVSFLFSITTTETHTYRVERTFRYHKGNVSATVRNTGATLADITDEQPRILADRPTEVTQECIRLLGLNSDDFMRTVVLPQGQFSEFLKLKNAERRSMLQRIFHLEQYGLELTQKISSAKQKQELLLSNLDGQVQMFEGISRETLQELQARHKALLEDMEKTAAKKAEATQAFQEADAVRSLLIEYEPVRKKYEEDLKQMPIMEEKENRLALGKRAAQVRPFALQAEKSAEEAIRAQQALAQIQKELASLLTSCSQLQKEKEAASETYTARLPELLQKEQDFRHAAEQSQFMRNWMNRQKETEAQLQGMQETLSELKQKDEEFRRTETSLLSSIAEKEQKAAGIRPSREELHGLEQGHLLEETYREKHSLYEEAKQGSQEQRQLLESEQASLAALTGQLTALHDSAQRCLIWHKSRLAALTGQLAAFTEEKASVQKETEELQNKHMALVLRSRLKDGDICPVCGNVHHGQENVHPAEGTPDGSPENTSGTGKASENLLRNASGDAGTSENDSGNSLNMNAAGASSDSAVLSRIRQLQAKTEELTRQEKELEASRRETEEQIASVARDLETICHLLPELSEKDDGSPTAMAEPHGAASMAAGITPAAADTGGISGQTVGGEASLRAGSSAPIPAADSIRRELQPLSSQFLACRERFVQRREQYEQLQQQNREQYERLQQSGQEILALREQWHTKNFTETLAAKRAAEKEYDRLQEELRMLRQQLEDIRKNRDARTEKNQTITGQVSAAQNDVEHFRALIEEAAQKLPAGHTFQTDFTALLEEAKAQRELLEQNKTMLEQQYQQASQALQAKKEEASAAENQRNLCLKNQKEAEEMLKKQLSLAGFSPDTVLMDKYLPEETLAAMEKELSEFRENFAKTKERLAYQEEKKQNQSISEEEWRKRKEAMEQTSLLLEQQQKEEAVLSSEVSDCEQKLKQKNKLLGQQKEALHRRGLIRQLEQLFKGNAFIEYVAESRLRYIASEASVILSSISNGSYELEINENAEFVIRDNKNGGSLRPCDTLSGGETFITSLSLALALSSVIQLNGTAPLELFFLDEGFGNLDDELLDVVMTSLERLQSTRRSIGIITHVEAIQARVPVKLIITPSDDSQNGSSIRMEYS